MPCAILSLDLFINKVLMPMTELLLPPRGEHHTVADWEFAPVFSKSLDTSVYVVAPSSLLFRAFIGTGRFGFFCTIPDTLCIPDGMMHTWWRSADLVRGPLYLWFRCQTPPGAQYTSNSYFFQMYQNGLILGSYVGGLRRNYWSIYRPRGNNTWYQYRITWWQSVDVMLVRVEEWSSGDWLVLADNILVSPGLWYDAEYNRVGLGQYRGTRSIFCWCDETYIYKSA